MKYGSLVIAILLLAGFSSCTEERTSSVLFQGPDGTRILSTVSRDAESESISLSKSKEMPYRLDAPVSIPGGYSLEIVYSFSGSEAEPLEDFEKMLSDWDDYSDVEISFGDNQAAWILPVAVRALEVNPEKLPPKIISYAVPLAPGNIDAFTINIRKNASPFSHKSISLNLLSLKLIPRWFGLIQEDEILKATPFAYLDENDYADVVTIDPPEKFWMLSPELHVSGFEPVSDSVNDAKKNYVSIGNHEYSVQYGLRDLYFGIKTNQAGSIEICGQEICSAVLQSSENRAYPLRPITLSPGGAVAFDREGWRRDNYEVFRWDQFPEILIFDTADYDVQDRFFKRLAFFVEKAGFQGSLSTDEEIAHLHGWNAHDYRAEDLARFFETARVTDFPLNREELELQKTLLDEKIIVRNEDGGIVPGFGAIVSISRESVEYLRYLFIVHECYHGLYFIDKDFEAFCRSRWENLDPTAKGFITEYFASQRYDTQNEYLMANELMAYCLQQRVNNAGNYFGETLAGRIYANPARRRVLPEKDASSNYWPLLAELFTEETRAFSEYVNTRWGLRAGTVTKNR